jgi:N-acetylneuraminate synthase/N,N'-diacetyllegionaminate synthase
VLIIAEAGVAHFGSREKALALVDLAADAGADVFKTQAFSTDEMISSRLPEWRERMRPKEVGFDFIAAMKARCDERGLPFMCTAHDESVLPWLDELDVPAFKIGSGERGNTPYIRRLAERGKPIVLSTGMYDEADIDQVIAAIGDAGCRRLALLHCVTSYPTPPEEVNLRAMNTIARLFPGPVGYSDHTRGDLAVLGAVALGARVIEKHIALDFDIPNAQDWKVACGPHDFPELIRRIRDIERMIGDARKIARPCETPALEWALKSLVAVRDLPSGSVLDASMLTAKRPGDGVSPAQLPEVLGKVLVRPLAADEPLTFDALVTL